MLLHATSLLQGMMCCIGVCKHGPAKAHAFQLELYSLCAM